MRSNNKPNLEKKLSALEERVGELEGRLGALAEGMIAHRDACLNHGVILVLLIRRPPRSTLLPNTPLVGSYIIENIIS